VRVLKRILDLPEQGRIIALKTNQESGVSKVETIGENRILRLNTSPCAQKAVDAGCMIVSEYDTFPIHAHAHNEAGEIVDRLGARPA